MARDNDSTKNKNKVIDDWLDDDIVNDSDNIETDTTQQENLPLNPPAIPPVNLRHSNRIIRKLARYCDSGH